MAKKTEKTHDAASIVKLREELQALRTSVISGTNRNVKQQREIRKEIARALTAASAKN